MLALDPIALRALVKVSGPVDVQGTHIDADNIVHEILLQQYIDYAKENPNADGDVPGQRSAPGAQRRDRPRHRRPARQGGLAPLRPGRRPAERRRAVATCSSGRPSPSSNARGSAAGVSGILPSDGLMISLDNRAGNKLDQFLPVTATIAHRPVHGGSEVTVRIQVANLAPDGLPRYVQGPVHHSRVPGRRVPRDPHRQHPVREPRHPPRRCAAGGRGRARPDDPGRRGQHRRPPWPDRHLHAPVHRAQGSSNTSRWCRARGTRRSATRSVTGSSPTTARTPSRGESCGPTSRRGATA